MFCGLSDTERLGDVVSLGAVKLWEDVGMFQAALRLPAQGHCGPGSRPQVYNSRHWFFLVHPEITT